VGLVGLIIFLVLAGSGRIGSRLMCEGDRGRIYAETFALWLLLWVGMSLLLRFLALGPELQLGALLAGSLLSLVVLAWPVQRGISWAQVRKDIGLYVRPTPAAEPVAGLAAYIMALPLAAVGLIVTMMLMQLLPGGVEDGNPFASPGAPV